MDSIIAIIASVFRAVNITDIAAVATALATGIIAFFFWRQSKFDAPQILTDLSHQKDLNDLVLTVCLAPSDESKFFIDSISVRKPRCARIAKSTTKSTVYGGVTFNKRVTP